MDNDFAAKLRITAEALGCSGRKDLVARFRAANPATTCDLDRLHKWMQGKARPRSGQVYDDWAKVLGSARPGAWLLRCPLEEFRAEVIALHGARALSPARPLPAAREPRAAAEAGPARASLMGGVQHLCGHYAAYSHAWSPYYRGALIRGALHIAPTARDGLAATYTESLVGGAVRLACDRLILGQSLHMLLREPGAELPVFMSLHLPRPPASVLCGILSGAAFVSPEPTPTASRIVMVRVPGEAGLEESNRYLMPEPGAIARDLRALGLAEEVPEAVERRILEFLGPPESVQRAPKEAQAALSAVLDPLHLLDALTPAAG